MAQQTQQNRKVYNTIPKDSSLAVKPLEKNELAKYRLLGVYDPITRKKSLRTAFLPKEETVIDEHGNLYDIAAIKKTTADGVVSFIPILFDDTMNSEILLTGKSIEDKKIYERLELSNYNASNVNADPSVAKMFERVSIETDSEQEIKRRKTSRQAQDVVDTMTDAEVKEFLFSINVPVGGVSANRNTIELIAEKEPMKLLKASVSTSNKAIADEIANLKKAGVINYNHETKTWDTYDGKKVLTVKKVIKFNPDTELLNHLIEHPEALTVIRSADKQSKEEVPEAPKKVVPVKGK